MTGAHEHEQEDLLGVVKGALSPDAEGAGDGAVEEGAFDYGVDF